MDSLAELQQPLPFTVLKPYNFDTDEEATQTVATALTVYGIETRICFFALGYSIVSVATALTVYGIETTKE